MKRGHTALEYKQKIRKLRAVRPDISISTDIIVGFPGETDADFEATMKLVEDIGFDQSFTFIYSRRPGTPASNLADDTPEAAQERTPVATAGRDHDNSPQDQRGHDRQHAARSGREAQPQATPTN